MIDPTYEPTTSHLFAESCKGKVVADVGAYAGHYTELALKAGAWRVLAFEARLSNYLELAQRFQTTDSRLELLPYAISDRLGAARLHYDPKRKMTASLVVKDWHTYSETVITAPLDTFRAGFEVIKIDVEGAEPAVIRGARHQIFENKPDIFIEVLSDEIGEAIERALPIPYKFYRISEDRDQVWSAGNLRVGDGWGNFLLKPDLV